MNIFGTKAETLETLRSVITKAKILPLLRFSISDWRERQEDMIKQGLMLAESENALIVRSSALGEDGKKSSQAGKYKSVLNVAVNSEALRSAVEEVIMSYENDCKENQVFIQPMLMDVMCSGVAFTMDPNTGGNYYVINYDDTTGSTESITSGTGQETKLYYQFKGSYEYADHTMKRVCESVRELEEICRQSNLDVEFAITKNADLYILQVRPLCIPSEMIPLETQEKYIQRIADKVRQANGRKPFLHGERTIYGVMPDWNPAEIIGIRPKPLASSLYREIITDNIWAYQRDNYGYKNLRSFPLMVDFCGLPYIDVRVSFNSFIPKDLPFNLSERLINFYMDRLEEDPSKHDKVEFEIVFTCYTFDLPERIQVLKGYGFEEKDINAIVDALRSLTNKIIDNEHGLWKEDLAKIEKLEKRYQEIVESRIEDSEKLYWLLEDCKRYGTLPFAGLARAGFIAVQILKSLITKGILTEIEYQAFMENLETVSTVMSRDREMLGRELFLEKFGHLRPGTYDINSKRYDEAPDLYFDWSQMKTEENPERCAQAPFKLSLKQLRELKTLLQKHGLKDDVLGLFEFIKTAIEGREYAKFIFTKNLSKAMQLFGKIGKEAGYSIEECAYADIGLLRKIYSSTPNVEQLFGQSIENGKAEYEITRGLTLPPLIVYPRDVSRFYYPSAQPNYITLKKTCGEICYVTEQSERLDVAGKILLIPNADPGYDWIFLHGIKGFITKWGGANSHMAIRAGELGIPAAIGIGEMQFQKLLKAKQVELDAQTRKVIILR